MRSWYFWFELIGVSSDLQSSSSASLYITCNVSCLDMRLWFSVTRYNALVTCDICTINILTIAVIHTVQNTLFIFSCKDKTIDIFKLSLQNQFKQYMYCVYFVCWRIQNNTLLKWYDTKVGWKLFISDTNLNVHGGIIGLETLELFL